MRISRAHSDVRSDYSKIFQGEISFTFIYPYHLTQFSDFGCLFLVYMVFVGGCGRCYGRWPLEMLGNSECWRMRMLDDMVPRDLFDSVGKNGKSVERFLSLLGQIPELFKSGLKQSKEVSRQRKQ